MCGQLCHSCQLCYHPDVLQLWMLQPRAPSPAWASHTPQLPAVLQPPRLCPGSSCAPAPAVPPPAVLAPLFCAIPPHTFARSRFCPSCAASPSCAPPHPAVPSCAQLRPRGAPWRPRRLPLPQDFLSSLLLPVLSPLINLPYLQFLKASFSPPARTQRFFQRGQAASRELLVTHCYQKHSTLQRVQKKSCYPGGVPMERVPTPP